MMRSNFNRLLGALCVTAGLAFWVGCDNSPSSEKASEGGHAHEEGHDHGEEGHDHEVPHNHPTEGPHHGSLIELGDEEYHGEFLHDEKAGTVTVYVLDSAAKKVVPVAAGTTTINVRLKDGAKSFQLKASPAEGDPAGKSSRFVSSEKALHEAIDAEGAEARFRVTIGGTPYSGKIPAHDHDHDHDHGDGHKH